MSHLLGLRAATAVGAHLSTYRGGWGAAFIRVRHRAVTTVLRCLPSQPLQWQLLPVDAASLLQRVEGSAAVPTEAKRAFRLFAEDLQVATEKLSLWARCVTRLAVEAHVQSHETLQKDVTRHSAVSETPLRAPVFIVGLPRTGTTFLHHLLALDPDSQCLRAFELMRPTRPLDGLLPSSVVDFLDWARLAMLMRAAEIVAPQWPHHHSLDASSPEECLFALQRSMPLDTHYRAKALLPSIYADDKAIPEAAYEYYRLFLQQVQLRRGTQDQHYVLKGQLLHLQYMSQLRSAFPEARVIWAHRPAEQVVGSLCSLRRSQHEVFLSEGPDLKEVGYGVLSYLSDALTRAGAALEADECNPKAQDLLHVQYESLVANPVAVVEEIYGSWGLKVSPEFREAMEQYLERSHAERSKSAHRRHVFHDASLSRYGLDKELVRGHFTSQGSAAEYFADMGTAFQGTSGVLRHSALRLRQ